MSKIDPSKISGLRKCGTFLIFCIMVLICPLFILNSILNLTIRQCVRVSAKVFQPHLKMLNHMGHLFTLEKIYKSPQSSIVFQATFEGNLDEKECRRILQENVLEAKGTNGHLAYPELRQYLVQWCGYYFWKDDKNFDLSNHFTVYQRPETGVHRKSINTDEDIIAIWNNLLNKPFKQNKPLWEVVIVTDYHPNPSNFGNPHTAFILLFHHATGDGRSWLHLLRTKLFHTDEQLVVPRIAQKSSGILHSIMKGIIFPFKLLYVLADSIYFGLFVNSTLNTANCDGKVFSNFTTKIPLQSVKHIAKSYHVSFTSVLLGGLTLALREFLVEHGKKPKPEALISPYPTPNHKEVKLRNQLSLISVRLPLSSTSPSEILKLCHAQYETNRQVFPVASAIITRGLLTGPGMLRNIFINRPFPITFTNFFFGTNACYFDEQKTNRCVDVSFNLGCGNGIGAIGARAISFEDGVRFSTVVDASIMTEEEAARFTKSIERHINDLSNLTV